MSSSDFFTCADDFLTPRNCTRAAQVLDFANLAVLVGELLRCGCRVRKHLHVNTSVSARMMLVMHIHQGSFQST